MNIDDLNLEDFDVDPPQPDPEPQSYLDWLRAQLLDSDGLDAIPDPVPLIDGGILYQNSLAWLLGQPTGGKSFVAISIAGSIATGMPWFGRPVTQGPVLYLAAEGQSGLKRRVRAWTEYHGLKMNGVRWLPTPVQMAHEGEWAALVQVTSELNPVLVVMDTQARIAVGYEENSNTDMSKVIERADRIRRATGACVLLVHHLGKNDDWRGASAMYGAADSALISARTDDQVKVSCKKTKEDREWDDIHLRIIPVNDSAVLEVDLNNITPASRQYTAQRKRLQEWWDLFKDEPTSMSALVKSQVFTHSTFYREVSVLRKNGLVEQDKSSRYRLCRDPTSPDSRVPPSHP